MILTTIIILLLIGFFCYGHRRGILSIILSALVYVLAWLGSSAFSRLIGTWLAGWLPATDSTTPLSGDQLSHLDLNLFFYRGIAFIIGFIAIVIILRLLIRQLNWLKHIPILGSIDRIIGGLAALAIGYVAILVILMVLQLWPNGWWQMQLANSELAHWMIAETPIITNLVIQMMG